MPSGDDGVPILTGQLRLPEFHGDSINYPNETWDLFEVNFQLAYEAAGLSFQKIPDEMKRAHLISGLKGKARRYIELNSEIRALPYDDLKKALKEKFDKPSLKGLFDIGLIRQKPDESVVEFLGRLKEAARAIKTEDKYKLVNAEEALKKLDSQEKLVIDAAVAQQVNKANKELLETFMFPYFMRGLREDLSRIVVAAMPSTLQEAVKLAEKHELYQEQYGALAMAHLTISEPTREANEVVHQAAKQLQALNKNDDKGNQKRREKSHPFNGVSQPHSLQAKNPLIIKGSQPYMYNQQRFSQLQRNNKSYAFPSQGVQNLTAPSAEERCFFCGRPGHRQQDCLTRARYFRSMEHGAIMDQQKASMQRRMPGVRPRHIGPVEREPRSFYTSAGKYPSAMEHPYGMMKKQLRHEKADDLFTNWSLPKNGVRSLPKGRKINKLPFSALPGLM